MYKVAYGVYSLFDILEWVFEAQFILEDLYGVLLVETVVTDILKRIFKENVSKYIFVFINPDVIHVVFIKCQNKELTFLVAFPIFVNLFDDCRVQFFDDEDKLLIPNDHLDLTSHNNVDYLYNPILFYCIVSDKTFSIPPITPNLKTNLNDFLKLNIVSLVVDA